MDKDAYLEINASQRPALALFEAMGYTYISPADCDKHVRQPVSRAAPGHPARPAPQAQPLCLCGRGKRVFRRQHRARHGGSGRTARRTASCAPA